MILSRVFGLSLGIFLIISFLTYIFVDFRPVREQAIEALNKQRYFTILDLYQDERFLEEEDYGILSLALDGITKEINTKPSANSRIRSAESLRRRYGIDFVNKGSENEPCIHLDDPYFPLLKKHAYLYHRSLMAKATSTCFCNPPEENTAFLNRILLEDPNQMIRETSETLRSLFESRIYKLEKLELDFLREIMHFLAEKEESEFYGNLYVTTDSRINLRLGPGKENPVIGQLEVGDELYCYDETRGTWEEEGVWKKCFSTQLFRSGWVFSKNIRTLSPSQEIISRGRKRFSNLEFYILIDFDSWNERIIPNHFHGNYIRTERVIRRGEAGFRLYRPLDGRVELICRKFSGRKNYLELYYEIESSELPIPILELQIVQGGLIFPAFRISAQKNFVFLNGVKFMIDRPEVRETLALKISSRSKGGGIRGTLIHKNKGVIENLDSYPIEERILSSKTYSWEVCIPQAIEKSKDSALLFGFRIGREE